MNHDDARKRARRWKQIADAIAEAQREIEADITAAADDAEDCERARDIAEEELVRLRDERAEAVATAQGLLDAAREAAQWMHEHGAPHLVGRPLYNLRFAIGQAERGEFAT